MDKSEMEDAGKESHEALDNLIESKDSLLDKKVEPDPDEQKDASLSNTDTQNSIDKIENDAKTVLEKGELSNTEIESQEQNNAKTEVLEVSNTEGMKDDKTDAETGLEDQNKLNTGSEDQNKTNTQSEDKNKKNTDESEDKNKANTELEDQSKANTELEDQNKTNTELEDQNKTNTELEDQNKTNTELEDQNKTNTELEDQNKTNTELEDQNKTNTELEDQNMPNTESEDQNMANTESEDQNTTNTESEDQNTTNTESEDQNRTNTELEDQNMTNTELEDQNMTNTELEDQNMTNTESDDQNMTNTESDDQNMTNTELEDQNKINIQLEDQNMSNTQSEDQNMTNTQSEDQNMTNTQSEDQNKINTQSDDQNMINTHMTNTQSEDQNNTSVKSEIMELTDLRDLEKEPNPSENGKNFENSLQSKTEDQKASQNVEGEQLQLQPSAISLEKKEVVDEGQQTENEGLVKGIADQVLNKDTVGAIKELKEPEIKSSPPATALSNEKVNVGEKTSKVIKHEHKDISVGNKHQSTTPDLPMKYSTRSAGHSGEASRNVFDEMPESEDGTPEEQAAFMKELENFYREKAVEFKPPKFYGQPLNCLKLWRAVIKLGGYDRVTGSKMWRQVGESFHPPKTCTTVSWTFRIFYEKSLLEYERYQRQNGDLQLPAAVLPEPSSVDNEGNGSQAPGSGRARRDAAARAMQGWHVQRLFGYGEDKNLNNMPKRENKLKSIGSLKQKRPNEIDLPVKAQRTETSKLLVTNVVDVGAPADWVKINVRETKDSFEVYALVPGLLREEVRVQSDPAGRLVITGQPEQPDNPWGITPFKKVVSLPARIDPLQTSAVVSLHGRLFVRVPFEQSNT